jgi:hypothetical protein
VTAPQAQAAAAVLPRWGVLDQHTGEWLARDLPDERSAWRALLDVDSLHPWELAVREQDRDDVETGKRFERCTGCDGGGDCWHCGQTCPTCYGSGEIEVKR